MLTYEMIKRAADVLNADKISQKERVFFGTREQAKVCFGRTDEELDALIENGTLRVVQTEEIP